VAGSFAGVVAGSLSTRAPGSGLAGRKSSGEEASVDRGRRSLECLGDLGDRFPGFVAADSVGEVPGHGARLARSGDGDAQRGPPSRPRWKPRGAASWSRCRRVTRRARHARATPTPGTPPRGRCLRLRRRRGELLTLAGVLEGQDGGTSALAADDVAPAGAVNGGPRVRAECASGRSVRDAGAQERRNRLVPEVGGPERVAPRDTQHVPARPRHDWVDQRWQVSRDLELHRALSGWRTT
jgi:hypothetical protein